MGHSLESSLSSAGLILCRTKFQEVSSGQVASLSCCPLKCAHTAHTQVTLRILVHSKMLRLGTSLLVQWLRIHLAQARLDA